MKQIRLTQDEVELLCGDYLSPSRRVDIGNSGYELEAPFWYVVRKDRKELSDQDVLQVEKMLKSCDNGQGGADDSQLDRAWAKNAIQGELRALQGMGEDNPHKPGSPTYACFIRLGSVIKGSGKNHYTYDRVLTAILAYCPDTLKTKHNRDKDLTYLFRRAYGYSKPRYRAIK